MHLSPSRFANAYHWLSPSSGVGVETIRLHQQRSLRPISKAAVVYRHCRAHLGERIWSVTRAQEWEFLLK